jgi:hypothetical protein
MLLSGLWALAAGAQPATDILVFDDGDPRLRYYDPSVPQAVSPSTLKVVSTAFGSKLPVTTNAAFSGKQSLVLEYKSAPGGDWSAFVSSPGFPTRDASACSNVVLFLNGPAAVNAPSLPKVGLESSSGQRTSVTDLGGFLTPGIDADTGTWQRVVIPLTAFHPFGGFSLAQFKTVFFSQAAADNVTTTVWLDNIRLTSGELPPAPAQLSARVGDRNVILHWAPVTGNSVAGYRVYRGASPTGPFSLITPQLLTRPSFVDFDVVNSADYSYIVRAVNGAWFESPDSNQVAASPRPFADDAAFLEYVQRTAFDFFWFEANPTNGLVRDRNTPASMSSIAAVGFGLTAIGIGVDHGWVSREEARQRVRNTLLTFWNGPQGTNSTGMIGYRGWFYHFLSMDTAARAWNCELSSIDTALFLAGALYARQYFSQDDPLESQIRGLATALFDRVDWGWMANGGNSLSMGWHPESGFIASRWIGYNEAMILYVLGMGATNNPVPASYWSAWTSGYAWRTNYGQAYVEFPPLFGHQYSHCWIDFRHISDAYMTGRKITYFENSRRATLAQRAYCIANPGGFTAYSSNVWGLTACDGPGFGKFAAYSARGAPPPENDDGTLAPTAPGGSLPFAPEICLPGLREMYDRFLTNIWCDYGFRDAFNPTANWWDPDVIGIDQGPILIMAENHRFQRVWRMFMQVPEVKRGLRAAGFTNLTFVPLQIQKGSPSGAMILTWPAIIPRSYQVEYSRDLAGWLPSPAGFLTASSSSLSWVDAGLPATDSSPAVSPQRFYRVLQLGFP